MTHPKNNEAITDRFMLESWPISKDTVLGYFNEVWYQGYNYRLTEEGGLTYAQQLKDMTDDRNRYAEIVGEQNKRINVLMQENDELGAKSSQLYNELRALEDTNRSLCEPPIKVGPDGVTLNHVGKLELHIHYHK